MKSKRNVKANRNGNIQNIKLTLLALIGTLLLSAKAIAADPAKQDGTAQEVTLSNPSVPDGSDKGVVAAATAPDCAATGAKGLPYYAKVGSMYVTWQDYDNEYATETAKKFYHAKPSESAAAVFERQIGNTLVTNAMLVLEAKRRKL